MSKSCIVAPCPSRFPDCECMDGCAAAGLLKLAAREFGVSLSQLDPKSPITENPYGDALVNAGLAVHRGRGNLYAIENPKAAPVLSVIR